MVLFAATMNLLVKSAENIRRGPITTTGIRLPPTRAFMDDLTITTRTVIECRWMLEETQDLIQWARMKFKPEKSQSLVFRGVWRGGPLGHGPPLRSPNFTLDIGLSQKKVRERRSIGRKTRVGPPPSRDF